MQHGATAATGVEAVGRRCPHRCTPTAACLVAVAAVEAHDDFVFRPRPGASLDVRVQVVVPPAAKFKGH